MLTTLQPSNLVLVNLYIIMALQLALNWKSSDCGTHSNFYQLVFITVMTSRVLLQQTYLNKAISSRPYQICKFLGIIALTSYSIAETVFITVNAQQFSYDTQTKTGNITCLQNRIIFVTEIILTFATLIRDVYSAIKDGEFI